MIRDELRPAWVDPKRFPFESRRIDIDGHRVHYVDEGPRDAPVLLFVHPAGGWSFTYRYQIKELRDAFRCVAPDLPGFGLSTAAPGFGYTLLEEARVLERFVAALGLEDIVVWANDGGGPTAVLALAPEADRVRGFVVGGTFGWSFADYPYVTKMIRRFTGRPFRSMNRTTNLFARLMGTVALGTRTLPRSERRQYLGPFRKRATRDHPLIFIRSFTDPGSQAALDPAMKAFHDKAALIQFGEGDRMTRLGWPERWAKEIPNARIRMLPGVHHFPFEDAPEATVENFRAWWAEIQSRSGPNRKGDLLSALEMR